jgi:hypothetical protein
MTPNTKWKLRHIVLPGVLAVAILVTMGITCWIEKAKEYALLEFTIALYAGIGTCRNFRNYGKFRP